MKFALTITRFTMFKLMILFMIYLIVSTIVGNWLIWIQSPIVLLITIIILSIDLFIFPINEDIPKT